VAAGWLAGERLQPLQWLGAVLVVVSVAAITIRMARPADRKRDLDQPSSAAASAQIASAPSASIRR
jgi:hypothetical protein